MVERVKLEIVKERPPLDFYKSLYLFWGLGFVFCFILIRIYWNLYYHEWLEASLWGLSLLVVLPPYNKTQTTSILKGWEKLLK